MSDCLSERLDEHFQAILIPSLLFRLINHLINTGHVVPTCASSVLEGLVYRAVSSHHSSLNAPSFFDAVLWIVTHAYIIVQVMENQGLVDHKVRLTDIPFNVHSPQFTEFRKLLDPELVEIRKQYTPDLFEEARQISSWMEFLQAVASGEVILTDSSFLKQPIFKPTLHSLEAKFQPVASSLDRLVGTTTSSSRSSRSSPHTSLKGHFKRESLKLLNILYSLLTSPLSPSLPKPTQTRYSNRFLTLVQLDDADPAEKFRPNIFDEDDDEILIRSLVRCRSVCDIVGADDCIRDVPKFFDRIVSLLGSSNSLVRLAALSLFCRIEDLPCDFSRLPCLRNRLNLTFHDGWPEEQFVLIRISTKWIKTTIAGSSLEPFPFAFFDWDGLARADLSEKRPFLASIVLIMSLQFCSIEDVTGIVAPTRVILSFERQQHAVFRINNHFVLAVDVTSL
ncbi:hypothetical protein BLNAU_18644 [Blattamonas nauphoetae]|uniref:Uncharacterized protein n=1 Tax=Blattamonas nauphoetae TaxID=2049346 RepID=A0ABQ9X480_9EUKA|nr:hypothetical protein BLNAU_18644 [Blattamonas nauphoetae]